MAMTILLTPREVGAVVGKFATFFFIFPDLKKMGFLFFSEVVLVPEVLHPLVLEARRRAAAGRAVADRHQAVVEVEQMVNA